MIGAKARFASNGLEIAARLLFAAGDNTIGFALSGRECPVARRVNFQGGRLRLPRDANLEKRVTGEHYGNGQKGRDTFRVTVGGGNGRRRCCRCRRRVDDWPNWRSDRGRRWWCGGGEREGNREADPQVRDETGKAVGYKNEEI